MLGARHLISTRTFSCMLSGSIPRSARPQWWPNTSIMAFRVRRTAGPDSIGWLPMPGAGCLFRKLDRQVRTDVLWYRRPIGVDEAACLLDFLQFAVTRPALAHCPADDPLRRRHCAPPGRMA